MKIEDINKTLDKLYKRDKQAFEEFINKKTKTISFSALKRLVLSELTYKNCFIKNKICGFSLKQIKNMIKFPERYGDNIVLLSSYMMLKSGYYKRLIEYFANMGVLNWTIDTEIKSDKFYFVNPKILRSNYIKFTAQCNKFKLDNIITDILKRLYISDVCFGFINETDIDAPIFFLEPKYCEIRKLVNGNVYQYAVNKNLLTSLYFNTLPPQLKELLQVQSENNDNNMIDIPYENSFCIKYNNTFTYLYPPFFNLIADILLIDDYKELAKAKTEADAYKLLYLKIPTETDGKISMGDELITPFTEMTKQIVPETWGVVPNVMDVELIESKSTADDDRNKVEEAVASNYGEAGVSKALISSASTGSELKLSIKVDSSDLYRIYRQIECWMELQMKLRGYIYPYYSFVYSILKTTIFDIDDYIDRQLKLAQGSIPNKGLLMAANGINTARMLGNSFMENVIFEDVFNSWKPLAISSVQSNQVGAPKKEETELSPQGEQTRNNDDNENRINKV